MLRFSQFSTPRINHAVFEAHEAETYKENGRLIMSTPDTDLLVVECEQIHGNRVEIIDRYPDRRNTMVNSCDGLITQLPNVTLLIKHADCLPVFLYDSVTQSVGLLHSGWKGTKDKIVVQAIQKMVNHFNARPVDIQVGIGVGAMNCCYYFEKGWTHEQLLGKQEWLPFIKRHGYRYYVDMSGFIKHCALEVGILETNIEDMHRCTICDKRFHSWTRQRQNGEKSKNGVSIIRLC